VTGRCFVGDVDYHRDGIVRSTGLNGTAGYHVTVDVFEQVPSDSLSFGEVAPDYQTANLFKYVNGDMIASSAVETGRTDYTVSMIVNISNKTPAGHYSGDYSAIVIPRF
jgi:hypothetical protein